MEKSVHTEDLVIGHRTAKGRAISLSRPLDLSSRKGELLALVGPNGCGKSTLLRTLAGLHDAVQGKVKVLGQEIDALTARQRAGLLSIVLTSTTTPGNMKVEELVALGRTPYRSALSPMKTSDREIVRWAMEQALVSEFADRSLDTLSDGETQRAMIARALAQETPVILLDEPTAHLDLVNRVEIVRMLRTLAHQEGISVILSTHDLDLVLRMADRIWLMDGNGELFEGLPEELALNGRFEEVFSNERVRFDRTSGDFRPVVNPLERLILEGDGVLVFWTRRALERFGYEVRIKGSENETADVTVDEGGWHYNGKSFSHLGTFLYALAGGE